jgi:hypothetical protein
LKASSNPRSYLLLKVLLKNRKVVELGACISISNGLNVDSWDSPWIPLMPNFRPIPNANLVVLPSFSVNDLLLTKDRVWNIQLLMDLFDPTTVQNIMSIHIPRIFI